MSSTFRLVPLAVVVFAAACEPTVGPSVTIGVRPRSIPNDGTLAQVTATATRANGTPGTGFVRFSAPAGNLAAPFDVQLRGGQATADFWCAAAADPACAGAVTITASWTHGGEVYKSTVSVTVTGVADAGAVDAGAAADAGAASDAGEEDAGQFVPGPRDGGPPPTDGGCPGPYLSGTTSVAYQVNAAHTGAQPLDELRLPLCRRWRRELGGKAGYPVVAQGRVFVAARTSETQWGLALWALDQHTGEALWGPVSLGATEGWAALSYGSGRVFAVTADDVVRAVDAATGALLWERSTGSTSIADAPPTAFADWVFYSAGSSLISLNAIDGGVRWSQRVANGDISSPAVSATGVYVSYACNQAYRFAPDSGAQQWHYRTGCSGGGGKTVALYRNRVYTRDSLENLVLNASDGGLLDRYDSHFIPSFSGDLALVTPGNALSALSLGDAGILWTLDAGGEPIITAPLVVGPHVIVASWVSRNSTRLLVVNVSDGTVASSLSMDGGVRGPDEQNVSEPIAGFAAADGMLFVPVDTALEAY
jgi:outer membrane protein assembly factor BamB